MLVRIRRTRDVRFRAAILQSLHPRSKAILHRLVRAELTQVLAALDV